jgi:PD-(D/E)XK endonuclease
MYISVRKGQEAVLEVQKRALEKGVIICFPTVEQRFDLVLVHPSGSCQRAQIKYANAVTSRSGGAVELDLRKATRNVGKKRTYTTAEIDIILVYLPLVDKVVAFGPKIFSKRASISIRLRPRKSINGKQMFRYQDYCW